MAHATLASHATAPPPAIPPHSLITCPTDPSCLPALCGCRDIDKAGGIDAYILNTPDKKLQSDVAMELRAQMLSAMARQVAPPRSLQTLLPRAAAAAAEAAQPAP